eukprot:jgi/Mesvir1/15635/Mv03240-RA.1
MAFSLKWIGKGLDAIMISSISWVLRAGRIPSHIAIIMDGNRRYADAHKMSRLEGHLRGFASMERTIDWLLALGVGYMSVYAFSIDNFKRSKDEIDYLMRLAEDKLDYLLRSPSLAQKGVRVRVVGDLSLAPLGLQRKAAQLMESSAGGTSLVVNICFSYTSRDEMARAANLLVAGVASRQLDTSDVDPSLFTACLRTDSCPPVDLLVRTSGETRLSDFLLWQSSRAVLAFLPVMWPDFSFYHLAYAVLRYQHGAAQEDLGTAASPGSLGANPEARVTSFLAGLADVTGAEVRRVAEERSEFWGARQRQLAASEGAQGQAVLGKGEGGVGAPL